MVDRRELLEKLTKIFGPAHPREPEEIAPCTFCGAPTVVLGGCSVMCRECEHQVEREAEQHD